MRIRSWLGLLSLVFVATGLTGAPALAQAKLVTVSKMENGVTSRRGFVVILRENAPAVMLSQQTQHDRNAEAAAQIVERLLPELRGNAVAPPDGSTDPTPPFRVIVEDSDAAEEASRRDVLWLNELPDELMKLIENPDDNWAKGLSPEWIRAEAAEKAIARLTSQSQVIRTQLGNLQKQLEMSQLQGAAAKVELATLRRQLEAARTSGEAGNSGEDARRIEAQNQQIAALRSQLTALQALLDDASARDAAQKAQLEQLGRQLNAALARAASEERKRRQAQRANPQTDADLKAEYSALLAAKTELQERLLNADAELTALTINLLAERKRGEDTLALLAASEAANRDLRARTPGQLDDQTLEHQILAEARAQLAEERAMSEQAMRQVSLLTQQTAALRAQLLQLQQLLDEAQAKDQQREAEIATLGVNLNTALARVAAEQRNRAELEAAERARLDAEIGGLNSYRSAFLASLSEVLGDADGLRIVGERFVFRSEAVFGTSLADVSPDGRALLARFATVLRAISDEIPDDVDWVILIEGHTDIQPLSAGRPFADNWELSQARALAVLRYLVEQEGVPPGRLGAAGFGAFQPMDPRDTAEAMAQNRRIELTFVIRPRR